MNYRYFIMAYCCLFSSYLFSQDTLRITIQDADKMFLQNNLLFLASQLNVDAQKAQEIQARLYPNPEFVAGINTYDNDNKKLIYAGRNGQKTFDFQQLILLGGKRKNEIRLSKENTKQAEYELENLLRNLRYELHTNMYSLHFDLRSLNKYGIQLNQLDTIINAYQEQANKGNIPLKEVIRLRSVYIRLNNDKTAIINAIQQQQKELQLLLATRDFIFPNIEHTLPAKFEQLPALDTLINLALFNRQDLKMIATGQAIADINVKYQKSLSVPDLTLGTSYDQMGGAFNHQYMFTVGIPLPIWNRNQGNIKTAEIQKKQAEVNTAFITKTIESEIFQAWSNMNRSIQEYKKVNEVYNNDFTEVFNGMQINFLKRNISIVEFVDFFESYSETVAEVYEIRKRLMLSAENINYTTAFNIF